MAKERYGIHTARKNITRKSTRPERRKEVETTRSRGSKSRRAAKERKDNPHYKDYLIY